MIKSVSVLILKIHQALARTLTVSLVDNITLTKKDRKVGGKIKKIMFLKQYTVLLQINSAVHRSANRHVSRIL